MFGLHLHADPVEWVFFLVALTDVLYAVAVRQQVCRDDRARPDSAEFEILSRAAVERATTLLVALGFFLMAGIVSLFMRPPDDDFFRLNDQAVTFRMFIMCGLVVIGYKLRRMQVNRSRYNEFLQRTDKRATDRT